MNDDDDEHENENDDDEHQDDQDDQASGIQQEGFMTYVTPPTNNVLLRTKSGMSVGFPSKVTHD